MSEVAEISLHRVEYLLSQFDLTRQELLAELNKGRQQKLTEADVFSETILYSTLKEIDKVFHRGLVFYFGENELKPTQRASILFRKEAHPAMMSLADKQLVVEMEDRAILLRHFCRDACRNFPEQLGKHGLDDDPWRVAASVREVLDPQPQSDDMAFLAHMVDSLAEHGVVVMEHVPQAEQNQSTIAGFFIKPYSIILVRNSLCPKNEIFTLFHELAHHLLDHECIDLDSERQGQANEYQATKEEAWCDAFAFAFLVGEAGKIKGLDPMQQERVGKLSNELHLSKLAIYKHLHEQQAMSTVDYHRSRQETIEKLRHQHKGEDTGSQKPIVSKLEKHIYAEAYRYGLLEEFYLYDHFQTTDLEEILNAM